MIAKGNHHAHGVKLAAYLVKAHAGERGELIDMRGFGPINDLRDGFRIEEIRAHDGTRAEKPFFHVHLRGAANEGAKLSREDWLAIADRVDKALGRQMGEQPRAASLHVDRKTGDMHLHLGYSLVRETDDGRLYVQKLGLYKNRLKEMSREIERDYGLKVLSNERRPNDLARAAGRDEFEEARRLGTDLKAIRSRILDCFERSDSGKAFQAALAEHGYRLANGDRRDCFVVIDQAGGQHALNKKLTGLTLAATRERLGDLDRSQLPGVEQAQELQAAWAAERTQERGKHGRAADGLGQGITSSDSRQQAPQPEIKPLGKTASEIRLAWQLTKTAEQFAQAIEDRGLILVHVSREEGEDSRRRAAFAAAIGRQNRAFKEGFAVVDSRGNVIRIDQRTTGDHLEEIEKRLAGIDRRELLSVGDAKEAVRDANRIEWREKRRAERDASRPASELEMVINDVHRATTDSKLFIEALDQLGITITRATAADAKALDALRRDQDMAAISADTAGAVRDGVRQYGWLEEGDLAAVTRWGDVHRISVRHLEHGVEERATGIGPIGGVIEARAAFEIKREEAVKFQQEMIDIQLQRRADKTDSQIAADAVWEAASEAQQNMRSNQRAVGDTIDAAKEGADTAGRAADGVVSALGSALGAASDFIAPPPKLTPEQAKQQARAEEEAAQVRAAQRSTSEYEARLREILQQDARSRALRREAGQEHDRDDDRGRERDRS
jgi:hypothetical protein